MKSSDRPSWKEIFFEIVEIIGKRSTCDRGRMGALIVKDNRIISTGYSGSPPGMAHCDDVGHLLYKVNDGENTTIHCFRTVHAEMNAICQAARRGISTEGSSIYCLMFPCRACAMSIVSCGIKEVFCLYDYHNSSYSKTIFDECNVSYHIERGFKNYKNQKE